VKRGETLWHAFDWSRGNNRGVHSVSWTVPRAVLSAVRDERDPAVLDAQGADCGRLGTVAVLSRRATGLILLRFANNGSQKCFG
jgi:hypothetical protein